MSEFFAIGLYFSLLFLIAKGKRRKSITQGEFVLGSRSMNRWTTALAAHASDMSNWLFMAYPGAVYVSGGSHVWAAIGLCLMMWANWSFVAPRIRVQSEKHECVTLSGFFASRIEKSHDGIRICTSLALFFFYSIYIAAALCGIGILLNSLFSIPYFWGVLLGVLFILPFVLMGGYSTLARVDLFQGLFLLLVILFVPLYVFFQLGGISQIAESISASGKSLSLFPLTGKDILLLFGWGLGYFGQPHILTKYMGIRDPKEISSSKNIGMSWQILILTAATFVGFAGIAAFNQLSDPEHVFIALVKSYFSPFIIGLFLCAILAAILNAVSSMLLVLSSSLTEDIFKPMLRKKISDQIQVRISRATCIFAALIGMTFSLLHVASIDSLVKYAWSGLGATFGPLVIANLYFSRIGAFSSFLGMLIGGGIVALSPLLGIEDFSLVVAFPASLLGLYIFEKKSLSKNVVSDI